VDKEGIGDRQSNLALQHADLAVLDVHVVLELGELAGEAIALLNSLQGALGLLLDQAVLLLKAGAHLLDIRLQHVVVLLFGT